MFVRNSATSASAWLSEGGSVRSVEDPLSSLRFSLLDSASGTPVVSASNDDDENPPALLLVDGETRPKQTFSQLLTFQSPNTAANKTTAMWPYQSYKPVTWDRYYANDMQDKHVSLTSGFAAGITIGVFFAVFLLTFGCRLYSQRNESSRQRSSSSARRRLSVSDLLGWPCAPCQPPPPYEVAIRMPPTSPGSVSPPPFGGDCSSSSSSLVCSATAPPYDAHARDTVLPAYASSVREVSSVAETRGDSSAVSATAAVTV